MMARAQGYLTELDGYAREQATRPQTIGYALTGEIRTTFRAVRAS